MLSQKRFPVLLIVLFCCLVGCQRLAPAENATVTPLILTQYSSAIAPPPAQLDVAAFTPTAPPPPSPTPVLFEVASGDTLLGIATRYGITLETLLAANPGVDPQFLAVGTVLHIPAADGSIVSVPEAQATPIPLEVGMPICYADVAGGEWCVIDVHNNTALAAENVVVSVQRFNDVGDLNSTQNATLLVNRLPAGETLPVLTYFSEASADQRYAAQLISALSVPAGSARYLDVFVGDALQVAISVNGTSAEISGSLGLSGTLDAARVWLLAVAYDVEGNVVGVRRWESTTPLSGGGSVNFMASVFSLGPPISSIKVFPEAQP